MGGRGGGDGQGNNQAGAQLPEEPSQPLHGKATEYAQREEALFLLPAAKPSGPRTVRVVVVVVVVVVGGSSLMTNFWISSFPTLNFLRGGIRGSLTRFLLGVGSGAL